MQKAMQYAIIQSRVSGKDVYEIGECHSLRNKSSGEIVRILLLDLNNDDIEYLRSLNNHGKLIYMQEMLKQMGTSSN